MGDKIAISITLSSLSRLFGDGLAGIVKAAQIAEDVGLHQISLPDHLAISPNTDRYPYGAFPYATDEPWLEPLTTLAAIAGATKRIRLATGVLIAPLRPALLLAKTVATLDVLSEGRVDLGVGLGWQQEEFSAAGVPFHGRAACLDDTLHACRALWTDAPASVTSETVRFENLWCLPRPVQKGGIPIWFGVGLTQRNIARIVEFGVGWMPVALDLTELGKGVRLLRDAFRRAGRDANALGVNASVPALQNSRGKPDLDRTVAALPELRAAGATVASFALGRFVTRAEGVQPFLEHLGRLCT